MRAGVLQPQHCVGTNRQCCFGGVMMKLLFSSIAALGMIGTPAFAADMAVKAPLAAPQPVWSWTGFYVGGDIGAKWMHDKWTATSLFDGGSPAPGFVATAIDSSSPRGYDMSGFRGGGYLGYNWQFSPTWVGGIEGDAAWANDSQRQAGFPGCAAGAAPGFTCVIGAVAVPNGLAFGGDTTSVKMLWDASARARLGYLVNPDLLLYATGGVAFQRIEVFGQCGPYFNAALCFTNGGNIFAPGITASTTLTGWTVGGGLEHHFNGNWLLRVEYRYADFGSWSTSFRFVPPPAGGNNNYRFSNSVNTSIFKLGLAYKF
jgi:outer membrane immunogenic protein